MKIKKEVKTRTEDTCAFCHSENIEHGVSEVVDHSLFYFSFMMKRLEFRINNTFLIFFLLI